MMHSAIYRKVKLDHGKIHKLPENWKIHAMKYTPVGVDMAKHLIQIHFIDEYSGEVVDNQRHRQDFLAFFSNLEPCLIGAITLNTGSES